MRSKLPDLPTIFLDRSLGKHDVADALRREGIHVVLHDDEFDPMTPDEAWLASIAKRGWIALTKDTRIRYRQNERSAVIQFGARLFVLTSAKLTGSEMAGAFVLALPRMQALVDQNAGPFVATVTRAGQVALLWPDKSP